MRKSTEKRHKHGTTSFMVFAELVRLYQQTWGKYPVSRYALIRALKLAETTIDDRLRVLIKKKMVQKAGRGHYKPYEVPTEKESAETAPLPRLRHTHYFLKPETDPGLANAMRERRGD